MITLASDNHHKSLHTWPLWLTVLIVMTAALTWPAMKAPILLDDESSFRHVSEFTGWSDVFKADAFGLFRPAKNAIFYLFAPGDSINLTLWHSLVLASFLVSIAAVFFMLRVLLRSDLGALVGATIWTLTPTQSCLAVWMSCINISMCVIFLAVFVMLHIRASKSDKPMSGTFILASLSMFLAQASYETAVASAGLAFLIDELIEERRPFKRRLPAYILYSAVTLGFLAIRFIAGTNVESHGLNEGFHPDIEPWQQSASAGWFMMQHLLMWLAPLGRIEFASTYLWGVSATPLELVLSWCAVITLLLTAWFSRKSMPLLSLGLLWFFGTSFPSSNVVPISAGPIEDYYLIIPSIGLVIAVIGILQHLLSARQSKRPGRMTRFSPAAPALIACILIWRGSLVPFFAFQASSWNTPLELYLRCADSRTHQYQLKALAARELFMAGRFEESAILSAEAYQEGPWHQTAILLHGFSLNHTGEPGRAAEILDELLSTKKPSNASFQAASVEMARIQIRQGESWETARETLLPVLQYGAARYQIDAIHILAEIYDINGMRTKALQTLERGIATHPNHTAFVTQMNAISKSAETSPEP